MNKSNRAVHAEILVQQIIFVMQIWQGRSRLLPLRYVRVQWSLRALAV
jgi:hypothetical protein